VAIHKYLFLRGDAVGGQWRESRIEGLGRCASQVGNNPPAAAVGLTYEVVALGEHCARHIRSAAAGANGVVGDDRLVRVTLLIDGVSKNALAMRSWRLQEHARPPARS
jgi:hypothetical protein